MRSSSSSQYSGSKADVRAQSSTAHDTGKLISKIDFADSESSHSHISVEAEADAATIYSIIQDYEVTQNFLFDEDFDSTTETEVKASKGTTESRSIGTSIESGKIPVEDSNIFSNNSALESSPITFVTLTKTEKPSIIDVQKKTLLILSTEISFSGGSNESAHADEIENMSIAYHPESRVSVTTPMKPQFSPAASQRVSMQNSLNDRTRSSGAYQTIHSRQESGHLDGVGSAKSFFAGQEMDPDCSGVFSTISYDAASGPFPYTTKAHRPAPLVVSDVSLGQSAAELVNPCYRNPILGMQEPSYSPTVPTAFPTRDSTEKQRLHRNMLFASTENLIELQGNPDLNYSWAKWSLMMISAFLVVPIFFLLALGMLDKSGFYYHDFVRSDEKIVGGLKYHQRYTANQKILSFFLGVLWLSTILSMIGVGFGLGLTRL